MLPNYEKEVRKNLREIEDICRDIDMPKGKYLQIVNRCAKATLALIKQSRAAARGAVRVEVAPTPAPTHAEVVAECDKRIADRQQILSWLQEGRKVTTVDCIEHNILRASDVIFRLRKDGWPIATKLIKSGRARIAEYTLLGPQCLPGVTEFSGFDREPGTMQRVRE